MDLVKWRTSVHAAYRRLWRAQRHVFNGDLSAQNESKKRIRFNFRKPGPIPATEAEASTLLKTAYDTAELLEKTVIQARWVAERNVYRAKIEPKHTTVDEESKKKKKRD